MLTVNTLPLLRAIACAFVLLGGALAWPTAASAQESLVVRPMKAEITSLPGRNGRLDITVRNQGQLDPQTLDVSVVDIRQDSRGNWRSVADGQGTDIGKVSARDWVSLVGAPEQLEVAPGSTEQLPVRIEIPRRARGVYFAAVALRTEQPEAPETGGPAFTINFEFLVPIVIEIQGRAVRQKVRVQSVDMNHITESEQLETPTTVAEFAVANNGRSMPEVAGQVLIERRVDEAWRMVTRVDVPETSIAPGNTVTFRRDLERRLPSGRYRLRGTASVNGRRIAPEIAEIDFEGDPDIDRVAYDTALRVKPDRVVLDIAKGAVRSATVTLENPGKRRITVQAETRTPEPFKGVAIGALRGEALSAKPYVEARPDTIRLRPGQTRRVRVMARMPRETETLLANYYARLSFTGRYASGQSAGAGSSLLHLRNREASADTKGAIRGVALNTAGPEQDAHLLSAHLRNTGLGHVTPTVTARLADGDGTVRREAQLSGENGWLLPLEGQEYGGAIDFTGLEPGPYTLLIRADFDGDKATTHRSRIDVHQGSPSGQPNDGKPSDFDVVLPTTQKTGKTGTDG
jgi:hypothetical protein